MLSEPQWQEPPGPGHSQGGASVLPPLPCASDSGEVGGSLLTSFLVFQLSGIFRVLFFSCLRVHPVSEGRIGWPNSGGWGTSSWGRLTKSGCSCASFDYSHAAFTVYICFIVHRFVNIIA